MPNYHVEIMGWVSHPHYPLLVVADTLDEISKLLREHTARQDVDIHYPLTMGFQASGSDPDDIFQVTVTQRDDED